jgi:hypothetical protein
MHCCIDYRRPAPLLFQRTAPPCAALRYISSLRMPYSFNLKTKRFTQSGIAVMGQNNSRAQTEIFPTLYEMSESPCKLLQSIFR